MTMQSSAVTGRIAMLSNQWLEFAANDRARVLCWRLANEEEQLIDAFFAMELHERTSEHADLFVPFESEFASASHFGRALSDELAAHYACERVEVDAEAEQRTDAAWVTPAIDRDESNLSHLLRTCSALAKQHALPRHLVLVLRPRWVRDREAYQAWLLQFARTAPNNLRALVFDDAHAPKLSALEEYEPDHVIIRDAELRMPQRRAELDPLERQGIPRRTRKPSRPHADPGSAVKTYDEWSEETHRLLVAAGWYPGRRVQLLAAEWRSLLGETGKFRLSNAAEQALAEFGDLHVECDRSGAVDGRGGFDINPQLATGEEHRFGALRRQAGLDLFPIGEAYEGAALLAIDPAGRAFLVGDDVHEIGANVREAIEAVLTGRVPAGIKRST